MWRWFALVFAVFVVTATSTHAAPSAGDIDFGRYHALVVGNNEYQHLTRLETAVSDAVAVAEILRLKYGFEVTLLINATRAEILSTVNNLRAELTEKDRLLVYNAGHGELDRETGTGYWLPVDAEPENDTNWIANDSLSRHFSAMAARHVMVVADSCYSGALVRTASVAPKSGAERDKWFQRMAGKRARTALVSGGLEPAVDSGKGGHSVFANAFLGALRESGEILDGQTLAKRVSQQVVLNADQTPQYSDIKKSGHEGGDFLFVPKGSTVVVVTPKGGQGGRTDKSTLDLEFWTGVKDSTDPAAFAALARHRIEKLKAGAAQTPAEPKTAMVAPSAPVTVEEMDDTLVALTNANVRAAPTAETEKLVTLKRGTKVAVTGKVEGANWYRISRAGRNVGYVHAQLLGEEQAVAAAPPNGGALTTKARSTR